MRFFFSVQKATRRFIKSQQCHSHRGSDFCSRYRYSNASNPIQSSNLLSSHYYSTSTNSNAAGGLYRSNKVDLEIISREIVKPASPTPHHLRTFNISMLDQNMFDLYSPLIVFLPNTDKASLTDVLTKRSKHLKEALSQLLTKFHPFAGELKDNLHIECNDKGVYYREARVKQTLEDFLYSPDDEKVRELNPDIPTSAESSTGNYLIGVQVNIFNCGGIGLSTSVSHKIFDGHTYSVYIRAWAAASRGLLETISPSFVSPKIFPHNPSLDDSVPSKLATNKKNSTKRFVFDSTALAILKAQPVAGSSRAPTRMEATTAVIWKAAAKAASNVRQFSPQSPHALMSIVNLRKRASPPIPNEVIGNLIEGAAAICFPESQPDLSTLMGEIRGSIAKLNSDFIESMKGERGHAMCNEILRNLNYLASVTQEGDCLFATSLLNTGMYELDFGWGKPIWFYYMNSGFTRIVALNDMRKVGGIEAVVSLSPEEMDIFERDPELLSFTTVDPSPLQYLNDGTIN